MRTTLADRPGALAALAERCGEHEVNILALQIFPGLGGVTDELVLRAPDGWTLSDVAALVETAGGTKVSVGACTEQALVDGPTRYLTALRQVLHGDGHLQSLLGRLLDADPDDARRPGLGPVQDRMVVGSGAERTEVRRTTPFTPTEHARASSFVEAVAEMRERGLLDADAVSLAARGATGVDSGTVVVRLATVADTAALLAMHARCSAESVLRFYGVPMSRIDPRLARRMLAGGAGALVAAVDDRVVGLAALAETDGACCAMSLLVEDGWQRRGIGTRLLGSAARFAAGQGREDVVLRGPADSPAAVAMVYRSGLRARVRLSGDEMLVTISTRGLAPLSAVPAAAELPGPAPAPAPARDTEARPVG